MKLPASGDERFRAWWRARCEVGIVQVALHKVLAADIQQCRLDRVTGIETVLAARMKPATAGRVDRTGHIAFKNDALCDSRSGRVDRRHS